MPRPDPAATWVTATDVAAFLGDDSLADDELLVDAVAGIAAYIESIRTDLVDRSDPEEGPVFRPTNDVYRGAVMWAGHSYQIRSAPGGFASYGDGAGDGLYDLSLSSNKGEIFRLVGLKRPVIT